MTTPMIRLLGALAILVGGAFGVASVQIGFVGTGVALPTGDSAVEGRVKAGQTTPSPAGEPFLYGEVKLTRPGSRAMEQSWSAVVGDPLVTLTTRDGDRQVRLSVPESWRGLSRLDTLENVADLEGLPVLGDVQEEVRGRLQPPYVVLVRALREGDHVIALSDGADLTDVYVGERAELEQWLQGREAGRWPIVVLLGVMALSSFGLGIRAFRKS